MLRVFVSPIINATHQRFFLFHFSLTDLHLGFLFWSGLDGNIVQARTEKPRPAGVTLSRSHHFHRARVQVTVQYSSILVLSGLMLVSRIKHPNCVAIIVSSSSVPKLLPCHLPTCVRFRGGCFHRELIATRLHHAACPPKPRKC